MVSGKARELLRIETYMTDKELAKTYRGTDGEVNIRQVRDITNEMDGLSELDEYILYLGGRITNVVAFEEFLKFKKRNKYKLNKEPISNLVMILESKKELSK